MAKESMKDLEKQVADEDSMNDLPPVHQVMPRGKEQDPLILVDRRINPTCASTVGCAKLDAHGANTTLIKAEGSGVLAAKMNLGLKNWRLPYCLIASSVIVMTNHIHAAPKLIPPELAAMFVLFLCGIVLVFLAMKKQMM